MRKAGTSGIALTYCVIQRLQGHSRSCSKDIYLEIKAGLEVDSGPKREEGARDRTTLEEGVSVKVILVDDHALFRRGFTLLFKQFNEMAEVVEGGSLNEALELAERHPDASLMLIDLTMPGMNGSASIQQITAAYPQLPVIVLSAKDRKVDVQGALAAGALGFIPKSSSPEVMESAILLVLSGGVYLPPEVLRPDPTEQVVTGGCDLPVRLTDRQREVLRMLVVGMPNKQICRELNLGDTTVRAHIAAIFRALGVNNRTQAANSARRLGLID
jgi:two-component system nitrate/nitrite response regulator NarL